jgi:hypothetical protein
MHLLFLFLTIRAYMLNNFVVPEDLLFLFLTREFVTGDLYRSIFLQISLHSSFCV